MPDISSAPPEVTAFYLPNDMLDVPQGVTIINAAAAGTEVNAANILTRLQIDWTVIGLLPVRYSRVQVIGRVGGGTGTVSVRIRDLTAGADVCQADLSSPTTALVAGEWTPFSVPPVDSTYAVYAYGDGVLDPVLFAATWEWR